jgi:hypothetical protein
LIVMTVAAATVAVAAGTVLSPSAAGAAGASVSASLSTLVVDAKTTASVTVKAHVVDPAGATSVSANWPGEKFTPSSSGSFPMTLVSGTAKDGTWSASVTPGLCSTIWTVTVDAVGADGVTVAGTASAVVIPDAPDTVAPNGTIYVGAPGIWPVEVTAAPGAGVEFYTVLQDFGACGQTASGLKSVTVTAHPHGLASPVVTASLHLALDWTDPIAYGLHWAGTTKIPAGGPAGSWDVSAVASDNAGNTAPQDVYGTLTVS